MDQNFKSFLKLSTFALMVMLMAACSSSKVDEGEVSAPADAVASDGKPVEANTDAVPAAPPADNAASLSTPPAPDSLAGNPDAAMPAPIAQIPEPSAPIQEPAVVSEPAPIMESAPIAEVAQKKTSKKSHKKHGKKTHAEPMNGGKGSTYTVKKGDTLMKIAFENYGDLYRWKDVYEANKQAIADPNHVPPGTQLVLNGAGAVQVEHRGEQYLIKQGDTLGTISNDVYGTPRKWKKLWNNNRDLIKNPNHIYSGFYLFYQPEGRLSHDKNKKGASESSDSAAVAQPSQPREPASNAPVQPVAK